MKNKIIDISDFNKAKIKIMQAKKQKFVPIIIGKTNEFNRKILEKEKNIILLINLAGKKDKIKQRESGLNHVLVNFARKNNNQIGINLDEILESQGAEKAKILARIMQNIKFCNKKKVKMKFISLKNKSLDKLGLKSLGLSLGMPTWMAKGAVED